MIRTVARVVSALSMAVLLVWGVSQSSARANLVSPTPATPTTAPSAAAIVKFEGEVDDYHRDSFKRRFDAAKAAGAKTIIVEVESWGGLVTSGLDISGFLKRQSDVHTIAFVGDKAISAGAMIAVACDEIVMGPSAKIGDCAPITIGSDGHLQPLPVAERAKMQTPIVDEFVDSANRNHHDPLLMQAMVDTDIVVYWVEKEGQRAFVDEAGKTAKLKAGWKLVADVPQPIDSATSLLTVHTQMAVKLGIAVGEAPSAEALAAQRGFNIVSISRPDFGEAIIESLNGGVARMVLIVILGVCLYVFLHAPGHGAAEAIGVIALATLLGVPLLTGYGQWWQIIMILVGLGMISFEIFVFPHAGILIVGGILLMVSGLVLTFIGSEPAGTPGFLPKLPQTWSAIQNGLLYTLGGLVGALVASMWLSRYLPKLPMLRNLMLTQTSGGTANPASSVIVQVTPGVNVVVSGAWPQVGAVGRAVTPLRPGGTAEFHDQRYADTRMTSVVCDAGFVPAGTNVVVREVNGARIVVRPLTVAGA